MAEGEGAQSGAEGTQGGAEDSTTGNTGVTEGTGSGEGTQGGANQQTPNEADSLRAQLESQQQRTRAADQRAAKIEQELKQLRDKDLPEIEKLKRDFDETAKQSDQLMESNQRLALQVAFLSDNAVTWHDPKTALKLVDTSQVTIDDDGSVSGMKDALAALAKSHPYLVKTETPGAATPPPATSPSNNGGSGTGRPKTGALAARLPVMRTRIKPQ
jgi:hypothetical protein